MIDAFETDWLTLREPADDEARDRGLTERAGRWLAQRPAPHRIVDLGAGGGNNPVWLAPRLPGPQRWLLVDHDRDLLARAESRLPDVLDGDGRRVEAEIDRCDLGALERALPTETDLAAASALFDLCTAEWIQRLASRCATIGCAALLTLTVDGRWRFVGASGETRDDDTDAAMRARLDAHQRRDKGMGPALGGEAVAELVGAFGMHDFSVMTAHTPWRLGPARYLALAVELMGGWRRALHQQSPEAGRAIDDWYRQRRDAVEAGDLALEVGHVDVWAEPGRR
jgi:hypothetical protein